MGTSGHGARRVTTGLCTTIRRPVRLVGTRTLVRKCGAEFALAIDAKLFLHDPISPSGRCKGPAGSSMPLRKFLWGIAVAIGGRAGVGAPLLRRGLPRAEVIGKVFPLPRFARFTRAGFSSSRSGKSGRFWPIRRRIRAGRRFCLLPSDGYIKKDLPPSLGLIGAKTLWLIDFFSNGKDDR